MKQLLLIVVTFAIASTTQAKNVKKVDDQSVRKQVKNLHFSWNDCTPKFDGSNAAVIKTLQVTPDPVVIPGNVSVGFELDANVNLTSPSPFSIRIQKKVAFFWIDVPCQDGQGSCDYDDFCKKWPLPGPDCPNSYRDNNIPCECPFTAKHYKLPLSNVGHVDGGSLPKWLENGEYKIKAWATDPKSGNMLLCINLDLNLKAA